MTEKPKGFRKKLENFWYHYKIVVLIVAFFACSAAFLITDAVKKRDPDMIIGYASETYGDESQFGRVESELFRIMGDINGDGKTKINYRLMVMRGNDMYSYGLNQEEHFNHSFIDKNVRLYIIEDTFFDGKQLYFEPLEGILPPEKLEGGLKNENGEVCAAPLLGCPVAEKMDFSRPELYIALKRTMDTERHDALVPKQKERAEAMLKYIIEGDKGNE